jgi:hypothetical protein
MSSLKNVLKVLKDNESTISTLLGALVVIVLAVLLFTSARNNPQNQELVTPTVSDEGMATAAGEILEAEIDVLTPTPLGVIGRVGSFIQSILSPTSEPEPTKIPGTDAAAQGKAVLKRSEDGTLMPKVLPKTYVVKSGDTLWSVAQAFYGSGYNYVDIASDNKLSNADELMEGSTITLPEVAVRVPLYEDLMATVENGDKTQATNSYIVKKGDSLWNISVTVYGDGYGWTAIFDANKTIIADPGVIEPGWELTIPTR